MPDTIVGFLCLTPLFALRAAAPAGRPFGRVALLPSGCLPHAAMRCARRLQRGGRSAGSRCSLRVVCLTPLCALRAAAPAGRPFGRVALLPSGLGFIASRRYSRCARRLRRGGRSAGSRCSLRVVCLTPLCALRAAAPAGRPCGRVALLPSGFFVSRRYARFARRLRRGGLAAGSRCSLRVVCLTPLSALRAAAPAGRPFGRVALLPSGCLPHAAKRAARGGSGGAAFRPGRVAPL